MRNSPINVIIDTNLWTSFLISKNYKQLDEIILERNCTLVFSEELMDEFLSVIKRPKLRKFFTQEDTEGLIETIEDFANFFKITSKVEACRDVKDNFLLSLAKDSNANFLITGDKDLLELDFFEKTRIITITDFLKSFE